MNWGPVITAMATPFREDGAVDYDRAGELARRLVDTGSTGIVVAGHHRGVAHPDGRREAAAAAGGPGSGGGPCRGAGGHGHLRHRALRPPQPGGPAGRADGLLVVVPYYNRPTQEGLYRHFKTVAESTDLPVLMYNIPGRTGTNMLPETVARLSEVRNIAGIKEASGSLDQVSEIRRRTPEHFLIYSGDDSLTLPYLSVGAVGIVSVASHLVGREIAEMIAHFQAGRVEEARRIHLRLFPPCSGPCSWPPTPSL
jgi:4-hydroxy-tetrahydrodipicolinate synthase